MSLNHLALSPHRKAQSTTLPFLCPHAHGQRVLTSPPPWRLPFLSTRMLIPKRSIAKALRPQPIQDPI